MVGLVEAGLAAEGVDGRGHGVGELPADGRLGGERVVRDLDEGVAGGAGDVAGNDLEGFRVDAHRRIGPGGGAVPAHLEQARVARRRHDLEGALALDGDAGGVGAARHVGDRAEGVRGDAAVQGEGHVPQGRAGARRAEVAYGVDQGAGAEVRRVHHQVVAGGGLKVGRAGQGDLGGAAGRGGAHLGDQADDDAVGYARVADGAGRAGPGVFRADELGGVDRHGVGDREGNLLGQALLEEPGDGGGGVGLLVLLDDLGGHDHDQRNGAEDEAGDRERGEDLDEGERALVLRGRPGRGGADDGDHRKDRATVRDWVRGRPLIWYVTVKVAWSM